MNCKLNYSTDELTTRLRAGLEGQLIEGAGPWAFGDQIALYVGQYESVAEDLLHLYNDLSASERAIFRTALGKVICQIPTKPAYTTVYRTVISIAESVGSHEILPLLPYVSAGFIENVESDDMEHLYADTLIAAAALANPADSDGAVKTLDTLVTEPYPFASAYTGIALLAYCRASPDQLLSHLVKLRTAAIRMIRTYQPDFVALQNLVYEIARTVSLPVLVDALPGLDFNSANSDRWFAKALFDGVSPVLSCREAEVNNLDSLAFSFSKPSMSEYSLPMSPETFQLHAFLKKLEVFSRAAIQQEDPELTPLSTEHREQRQRLRQKLAFN